MNAVRLVVNWLLVLALPLWSWAPIWYYVYKGREDLKESLKTGSYWIWE